LPVLSQTHIMPHQFLMYISIGPPSCWPTGRSATGGGGASPPDSGYSKNFSGSVVTMAAILPTTLNKLLVVPAASDAKANSPEVCSQVTEESISQPVLNVVVPDD